MVKDFSWNISPWNALLFEKTLKQYQFSISRITLILNTCHDTAKRAETRVGFPDSDDRLSLNFHRFVILYISCDTRSVGLGQYCLPKVSSGFNHGQSQRVTLQNFLLWLWRLFFHPHLNLQSFLFSSLCPQLCYPFGVKILDAYFFWGTRKIGTGTHRAKVRFRCIIKCRRTSHLCPQGKSDYFIP